MNLTENYAPSNIVTIELYKGANKSGAVVLKKDSGGWVAESSYHAPADSKKIQDTLASFSSLEGKLRASGKEYFEDFQLADNKALHVVLSGNNTKHHLLIGKKEGGVGGAFIRHAEGSDVYLCDKDILRALDLWGDADPGSDNWIEKNILKLDKDQDTGNCGH